MFLVVIKLFFLVNSLPLILLGLKSCLMKKLLLVMKMILTCKNKIRYEIERREGGEKREKEREEERERGGGVEEIYNKN